MQITLAKQKKIRENLQNFSYQGVPVHHSYHDLPHDDLSSAGLGIEGLSNPTPPTFQDPLQPTPAELRRRAIYENYRALADTTEGGGFGRFYGPDQLIPGMEVRGVIDDATTVVLQIPESFEPEQPKLLLIPASSSRGVYGGILLSDWGLKRGYVTVLCDKGCGTGFHNLSSDESVAFDGTTVDAQRQPDQVIFRVPDAEERVEAFRERHPNRFATKHAHSEQNVEAHWGRYVLGSIDFAHTVLEQIWPEQYQRAEARVIATGLSNGGGSSLRAAEQDSQGALHAVAVGEPNVCPQYSEDFQIQQGNSAPLSEHSKTLLEYAAVQNLYQAVASLAPDVDWSPFSSKASRHRLKSLQTHGKWNGLSAELAAQHALEELERCGILSEQNYLASGHATWGVYEAMCVALANCVGRFQVTDHLFGYSYAAVEPTERTPSPLGVQAQAKLFATSNGLVPTGGLEVINDLSVGGPVQSTHSISPSTSLPDSNLDGAIKLYTAVFGVHPFSGEMAEGYLADCHRRISQGLEETKASARLGARPSIIVNGRCDSIIAPNHASRSYLGCNAVLEGEASQLRYMEIEHAQHLDALNALPGFRERFVPILPYVFQALDLVEEVLEKGATLPPNQVVRSQTRSTLQGETEALQSQHLPPISSEPGPGELIAYQDGVLRIPD